MKLHLVKLTTTPLFVNLLVNKPATKQFVHWTAQQTTELIHVTYDNSIDLFIQTYLTIQVLKLCIKSLSSNFAFDCGIGTPEGLIKC